MNISSWFGFTLIVTLNVQRSEQNGLDAVEEMMILGWGFQSIIQYFTEQIKDLEPGGRLYSSDKVELFKC